MCDSRPATATPHSLLRNLLPVRRYWMLMGMRINFSSQGLSGCWLLATIAAFAQPPAFEVASIKPSAPNAARMNIQRDPAGGIVLSNVSLLTLVSMAYNVQSFQLS